MIQNSWTSRRGDAARHQHLRHPSPVTRPMRLIRSCSAPCCRTWGTAAALAALVFSVAACTPASSSPPSDANSTASNPEFLTPFGPPTYPFSPAVRVGNLLLLSGQIGDDSTGAVVPGGIAAETRQTLDNIARILDAVGSSMDRVVKCTVMMADMSEWPAMNEVYRTYFTKNLPARSAFGATGLALGARVEIECLAAA